VEDLITSYEKLGCNMSLNMHFLHSRLLSFPVDCVVPSVTNMVNVFTRISQRWRADTRTNRMLPG
jgi:hypothetical protein